MADIQDLLLTLEKRLAKAEQDGDRDTLHDLISPDFEGVNSHGGKVDRDSFLHAFTSTDLKIESLNIEDTSVRIVGDVGLVFGRSIFKGSFKDQPIEGIARFTDVWLRSRDWKLIASQVTPVETFE